jgi:hypothetical protein
MGPIKISDSKRPEGSYYKVPLAHVSEIFKVWVGRDAYMLFNEETLPESMKTKLAILSVNDITEEKQRYEIEQLVASTFCQSGFEDIGFRIDKTYYVLILTEELTTIRGKEISYENEEKIPMNDEAAKMAYTGLGAGLQNQQITKYILQPNKRIRSSSTRSNRYAVTPEGKVKQKVKKILDESKAYYVMPMTGGYGNSGISDFIVCISGYFLTIETKAGKNAPTALQLKHMRLTREAGGTALIINEGNLSSLKSTLERLANGNFNG